MVTDEPRNEGNDEQALWRNWLDSKTEAARSRLFFLWPMASDDCRAFVFSLPTSIG